ncbi:hypothetical protein DM860_015287 [Cuscuta australis]|uniref:Uncharacterized protein n=1 Tax=Cuscuta australis TaxID=267555 RepID=A0A328DL32_9ASTE|nr:hypothetical protein DM860_015287 [Cuscuta australis]
MVGTSRRRRSRILLTPDLDPTTTFKSRSSGRHASLLNDYFNTPCVYTPEDFSNRFRMSRPLFLRILIDVERKVPWFTQLFDARGRRGFSSVQKCTDALRQMSYRTTSDMFDEYLKMSARSIRSCVYKFSKAIIQIYHKRYLRKPTASDIQQLHASHAAKYGFFGLLGSIDWTHWEWKNCLNTILYVKTSTSISTRAMHGVIHHFYRF